jgi:hypothetical protein
MINDYVVKLIENLPNNIKCSKTPLHLDLVLDGGLFNGSYLVGALYFLKEMEKRNYIKIERISGCSIGSIVAFLYFIDGLDMMPILYELVNSDFKKTHHLSILKNLKQMLGNKIPENICATVKNKLFISYYNVTKLKKNIKCKYSNVDELINTIICSCFVPYLIDGNLVCKNKYIDGINPYIFEKTNNKKILYLDLFGYDKIGNLLNVKNEKTNYHRILSGLLDIHNFFIKQSSTQMCSYVNDWNLLNKSFNYLKILVEKICIYVVYFLIHLKQKIPDDLKNTVLFKILESVSRETFIICLETYCL